MTPILRPRSDGTRNWRNRTIWTGDNLSVMRGMNSASVDLIYLDPPFNSNRNYSAPIGSEAAGAAFKDTWTLDDVDLAEHGEIADRNPALYKVIDAAGDAHGKGMKSYLIMMGTRLLEMRRLLKDTGSIYLHCDDTAGAWLKCLMDSIFGARKFRNYIIWNRARGKGLNPTKYVRNCDHILYYVNEKKPVWNQQYDRFEEGYGNNWRKDEFGPWESENLTGGKAGGPEAYLPFNGVLPASGRAWAPPTRDKFPAIAQARFPQNYEELNQMEKCEALDAVGLIHWPRGGKGMPRYKKYLSTLKGRYASDLIFNFPPIGAHSKERLGYPTQKPLALLKRIIAASSNPDDIVLDPFCGCATACIAAEQLDRQWVGIDLSSLAATLVLRRASKDIGSLFKIDHRTDIPRRTDQGSLPNYRTHKHMLYGLQEGICAGCQVHFPFRNLTVDHKTPRSRGGGDHFENLQLLCGACNSAKGDGTMAELLAKLNL